MQCSHARLTRDRRTMRRPVWTAKRRELARASRARRVYSGVRGPPPPKQDPIRESRRPMSRLRRERQSRRR
eukprot:scaffold9828_cov105-Isochrysis_galbana.AAC.4